MKHDISKIIISLSVSQSPCHKQICLLHTSLCFRRIGGPFGCHNGLEFLSEILLKLESVLSPASSLNVQML